MKKDYKDKVKKEKLQESKKSRSAVIAKYGFVPQSVFTGTVKSQRLDTKFMTDRIAKTDSSYEDHGYSVRGGALSQFPIAIGLFVVKMWSEPGDLICDPCFGRGQRVVLSTGLGRDYIGFDICKKFYDEVISNVKNLRKSSLEDQGPEHETDTSYFATLNNRKIRLYLKDAKTIHLPDNSADLFFTSPPYWDIEFYDDNPEQLGYKKSYQEFLDGMKKISEHGFRVLKPGKYLAYLINDFRKGGKFYLYHRDLCNILEEVGFLPHDIVIYRLSKHALGAIFATQLEEQKRTAKCHEYILVFKKPGGE